MTINEKEIFKPRFRKQHFRNGTIYLTDSEDIGKDLVYDDGNKICTLAKCCRPLIKVFSNNAIVYKAISDLGDDAVHIIIFGDSDDINNHAVYDAFVQGFNQVVYLTEKGEIYRWNVRDDSPRYYATVPRKDRRRIILYENGLMIPNDNRTLLPYDFYDYDGNLNIEERDKHLGGMLAFVLYLYLRKSPTEAPIDSFNAKNLFANEAISFDKIWKIMFHLSASNNYNLSVGKIVSKTITFMENDFFFPERGLTIFLDNFLSAGFKFSEEEKQLMFATDRFGFYPERRYQAEKHLKAGKHFKFMYDEAKKTFSHDPIEERFPKKYDIKSIVPFSFGEELKNVQNTIRDKNLRYIFLELTKSCNLHCEHCGSDCGFGSANELTYNQWINFIHYVAEHFPKDQIMFCITGGEPMLHPDFYDILNEINNCGFSWGLTTNGTLISAEDVAKLRTAGMKTVSISVDGLEKTHDSFRNQEGSFKKAINAFELLNKKNLFECVQITSVISKRNINELDAMYDYFLNLGVKDWRIASVDPIGRANDAGIMLSDDDYIRLFDFITEKRNANDMKVQYGCAHFVPERFEYNIRDMKYKCGAGIHVASILSNGDIFSCVDIERRPELIQGNILIDDFCKVWENGFTEFRGENRVSLSEKCSNCENREHCNGDAAHTWDYDKNEPKICLFEMLKKKRINMLNICGNCHKEMVEDATFCEYCGEKRGEGEYNLYDFNERDFQTLYGPPPERCYYTCADCGKKWDHWIMGDSETKNCPYCGSINISHKRDEWY